MAPKVMTTASAAVMAAATDIRQRIVGPPHLEQTYN